ncbi:MAG: hypothetical protein Tsb009_22570 [Planctomycetaceae bacterium]
MWSLPNQLPWINPLLALKEWELNNNNERERRIKRFSMFNEYSYIVHRYLSCRFLKKYAESQNADMTFKSGRTTRLSSEMPNRGQRFL